jgi:undecaprenyl-diphosphatase
MTGYTFDYPLFLWLNFDGGAVLDKIMLGISTPSVWAWLYVLILYMVWRSYGWRGLLIFLVAAAAAIGLGDMISGIFKHTGMLKNLWAEFPARLRPMYTPELEGLVSNILKKGGQYGTVSGHAATIAAMATIAIPTIARRWFTWMMIAVVLLICYSRIYLAYHFPVDIVLGLITGVLSGGVMTLVCRALMCRWCKQ